MNEQKLGTGEPTVLKCIPGIKIHINVNALLYSWPPSSEIKISEPGNYVQSEEPSGSFGGIWPYSRTGDLINLYISK